MYTFQTVFEPSLKMALAQVSLFVMSVVYVLFIILLGWILSKGIQIVIARSLKLLWVDKLTDKSELVGNFLSKSGIKIEISDLIGNICYWLALLITFVVSLNAVGLTVAADLLQKVVLFIPNIIAAVFVLIVGIFAAALVKNLVRAAANNAGIAQANLTSNIAEVVVLVFTVAIALDQLRIGSEIIHLTISIILGAFGLGFAIAFGLGCKDLVGKGVSDFIGSLKK